LFSALSLSGIMSTTRETNGKLDVDMDHSFSLAPARRVGAPDWPEHYG
jgi:hypothetical protein